DSSKNTKFAKQPIAEILPKIGETNALSKPVTSNSVSTPPVSKGVDNDKVIAPGMFRISLDKVSREAKKVPNTVSASSRTKLITVSQPPVITKKNVNSDLNGVDNTKTRRPKPRSNTKNDRVTYAGSDTLSWKPVKEVLPKLNLPGHRIRRWRCNLTPAESKFKNPMLDHQDKYMMKAQHILRGRLLASFQDLEHEDGDTRSQGGIKDNDSKILMFKITGMQMINQTNSQEQGSKFQERFI
nr:hypothetical protein [Tanacetum cinerariifolium]